MSLEGYEAELNRLLSLLSTLSNNSSLKDLKLEPEFIVSTISNLINFPSSFFAGRPLSHLVSILTAQIVQLIKSRYFNILEDVFYFMPKLKGNLNVAISDSTLVSFVTCSFSLISSKPR